MAQEILAKIRDDVLSRQPSDLAGRLQQNIALGFDRIEQFLKADVADDETELRRKQALLTSELIRTQARLDDTALRSEREDRFLEIIARANATLPPPEKDED